MNKLKQILLATAILLNHSSSIIAQSDMPSANAINNDTYVKLLEQLRKTDLVNQYIGLMLPSTSLSNKDEIQSYLTTLQNDIVVFQDAIYQTIARGNNQLTEEQMLQLLEFNSCMVESLHSATISKFKKLKQVESLGVSASNLEKQLEDNSQKLEFVEQNIEYMGLSAFNKWYREFVEKDKTNAIWASKVTAIYGASAVALLYFIPSVALIQAQDKCDTWNGFAFKYTSKALGQLIKLKEYIGDPYVEFSKKRSFLREKKCGNASKEAVKDYLEDFKNLDELKNIFSSPLIKSTIELERKRQEIAGSKELIESKYGPLTIIQHVLNEVGITVQSLDKPITVAATTYVLNKLKNEQKEVPKYIRRKILQTKILLRGGKFSQSNSLLKGDYELPKETLDDVICSDHVRQTCIRLIEQCANPKPFEDTKKKIKGVLFVGPSRTGKTLTAKAICGEINKRMGGDKSKFKFLTVVSSDFSHYSFEEITSIAEDRAPCILCIEEIDTLNLQKNSQQQSMNRVSDFLNWMDGMLSNRKSKEVVVVGITNDPHKLEKALIQPGRFEILVPFEKPGIKSRLEYLERQLKKYNISVSEKVQKDIALQTEGKTFTDIENLISTVVDKSKELTSPIRDEFFYMALDTEVRKIAIPQREYCPDQKKAVAIYQAGKIVATHLFSPERVIAKATTNPVKVDIKEHKETKSYFDFGGVFSYSTKDDFDLGAEQEVLNQNKIALAGAEAQKLLTGSYHYNHQMKDRQLAMDNCNKILLGGQEYRLFPNELQSQTVTQSTAILQGMSDEVHVQLADNRAKVEALAQALIKKTTLDQDEIYQILNS